MPIKTALVKTDKGHDDGQDLSQKDLNIQSWTWLEMKFYKSRKQVRKNEWAQRRAGKLFGCWQ